MRAMKTHPSAQTLGFSKVKKAVLPLFSVAALLAGDAAAVLDGFAPNVNDTISVGTNAVSGSTRFYRLRQ